MFCGKCGANNPDGASFCKECGTPLAPLRKQSVHLSGIRLQHGICVPQGGFLAALGTTATIAVIKIGSDWYMHGVTMSDIGIQGFLRPAPRD